MVDGESKDVPGAEFMKQNTAEVKKALIRNVMIKRERLRTVHLRKRQLKMLQKKQKQ